MNNNIIVVGMADLNVVKHPGILTTLGLGSCVGIALYDKVNKVAGLAHIMLPDSTQIKNNQNVSKFADTALKELLRKMQRLGSQKDYIHAKIAGGAQMFALDSTNEALRIGDRNVEAVVKLLHEASIPLVGQDTGDCYGRTVELYTDDGRMVIRTIAHGTKII